MDKIYSGWNELPRGYGSGKLTEGCIVLEGGAFRGVYTSGVLDVLMQNGINMSCVCGVSAGAINGINYSSCQIGRSARINLRYRHDKNYVGVKPMLTEHGMIGFDFIFGELEGVEPLDRDTFDQRRFVAVSTDVDTGRPHFWEKTNCSDIFHAVKASASLPYVSSPVEVEGTYNLDGGLSVNIPFNWAINQGYNKIIVIKTRAADYREPAPSEAQLALVRRIYRNKPALTDNIVHMHERYNLELDELFYLNKLHRVFMIEPSVSLDDIGRFESDMEKLGALYYLGVKDGTACLEDLKGYLNYL